MAKVLASLVPWPIFWDTPPEAPTSAGMRRLLANAASRDREMRSILSNVCQSQGLYRARRLQRRYLRSYTASAAAVLQVWPMGGRAVSKLPDEELAKIADTARRLYCWDNGAQRAFARPKEKRAGNGYRLIHKLPLLLKAADKLAANAAGALVRLKGKQFNEKQKGMAKMNDWLAAELLEASIVVTVDIPGCFDVVRRKSLEDSLPLPKQVVKARLFDIMDNAKRLPCIHEGTTLTNTHDVGTSVAKRGVPQGSALAQLAADIEIDKLLCAIEAVSQSVKAAAFGDNLIVLLKDTSELGSVEAALASATSKIFGADVSAALVHRIERQKPTSFYFCRRNYRRVKGKLVVSLPDNFLDDFVIKSMVQIYDAWSARSDASLAKCKRSIEGFARHHVQLKNVFEQCIPLLCEVDDYRTRLAKKTLQGTP